MSGREQGRRRRKDARVYNTYDALVCTQFFEKKGEERRRRADRRQKSKAKDVYSYT